jgi:hypothetical protein
MVEGGRCDLGGLNSCIPEGEIIYYIPILHGALSNSEVLFFFIKSISIKDTKHRVSTTASLKLVRKWI